MDLDNHHWEMPEDMNKFQNIYNVSDKNPGSDVAGENAAALAAASVMFRQSHPLYSSRLLTTSMNVSFLFMHIYLILTSPLLYSYVCISTGFSLC